MDIYKRETQMETNKRKHTDITDLYFSPHFLISNGSEIEWMW